MDLIDIKHRVPKLITFSAIGSFIVIVGLYFLFAVDLEKQHLKAKIIRSEASQLRHLSSESVYLDEVLTMSMMMAATTLESSWVTRYEAAASNLYETATEVCTLLADSDDTGTLASYEDATKALFDLEALALDQVKKGNSRQALTLLTNDLYKRYKKQYFDASNHLRSQAEKKLLLQAERQHARSEISRNFILAAILLLAAIWSAVIYAISGWTRRIANANDDLKVRLAQKTKLLIATAKDRALADLASSISHEINNPLTAIHLHLSLISDLLNSNTSTQVRKSLAAIENSSDQIAILRRTLSLFTKTANAPSTVSIDTLRATVELLCAPKLRAHDVSFSCIASGEGNISRDTAPIVHAVLQVIANAFEAASESDEKWVKVSFLATDDNFKIQVQNSGRRISHGVKKEMMDPFFTTKQLRGAVGLGLTDARSAVELNGGTLVHDDTAENTSFIITLPLDVAGQESRNT